MADFVQFIDNIEVTRMAHDADQPQHGLLFPGSPPASLPSLGTPQHRCHLHHDVRLNAASQY